MPDIFVPAKDKKEENNEQKATLKKEAKKELQKELKSRADQRRERRKAQVSEKLAAKELDKHTFIGSPIGPFSHFKVRPDGVRFYEQDDDERVLLLARKHLATNIPWLLIGVILVILPFFIYFLHLFTDIAPSFILTTRTITVLGFAYYILIFCYLFVNYITWYYNVTLITNKKVIEITFQDIIYHHVSITKINLIEDINYVQAGFFGSVFGYGNVFLETAGRALKFEFEAVPNPDKIVNLLENLTGGNVNA